MYDKVRPYVNIKMVEGEVNNEILRKHNLYNTLFNFLFLVELYKVLQEQKVQEKN